MSWALRESPCQGDDIVRMKALLNSLYFLMLHIHLNVQITIQKDLQ